VKTKKPYTSNLSDSYEKSIQKLDNEVLEIISQNREKALEYARKGIEQTEPDKLTTKDIKLIADNMQILARRILEERRILSKN
jgi:hypothetical protein